MVALIKNHMWRSVATDAGAAQHGSVLCGAPRPLGGGALSTAGHRRAPDGGSAEAHHAFRSGAEKLPALLVPVEVLHVLG